MKVIFFKHINFSFLKQRLRYMKLCYLSLTFNSHSSYTDLVFEPIITLVDFLSRWFGFAFVSLVTVLISYVVLTYYFIVIPFLFNQYSTLYAAITICYGHYLLIMISFHYFKAVRTDPGRPPKEASNRIVTSVCKKCILPKPPRTHHCSVCKNCVLKMDHHCPWINNCVGHFNHRYFISFCIFMWLGTFFVVTTTWPLFRDCFHAPHKWNLVKDWFRTIFSSNSNLESNIDGEESENVGKKTLLQHIVADTDGPALLQEVMLPMGFCVDGSHSYKTHVIFLWLLCMGVTAALGTLTVIQFRLVSLGETTVEKLINDKEFKKAKKLGLKYQNPYDLGFWNNWKMILNFHDLKSFMRNVIIPRDCPPVGDGLVWDKHINKNFTDQLYSNGR